MNAPSVRARIAHAAAAAACLLVAVAVLAAPASADDATLRVQVVPGGVEFTEAWATEPQSPWQSVTVDVYDAQAGSSPVDSVTVESTQPGGLFGEPVPIDLPPGTYRISAHADGWLPGWYAGPDEVDDIGSLLSLYGWSKLSSFATSTIVVVGADGIASVPSPSIMLFRDASTVGGIVGRWSDAAWDPARMWNGDDIVFAELIPAGAVDPVATQRASSGGYSFEGVAPGDYTIRATIGRADGETPPTGPADLIDTEVWWYPGTPAQVDAGTFTVEPGGGHWVAANVATDTEYMESSAAEITGDLYEGGLVSARIVQDDILSIDEVLDIEAYHWFLDGVPVDGATGATLVLPPGSAGRVVTVRIEADFLPAAMRFAYAGASASTVAPAAGSVFSAPVPVIGGVAVLGRTLTAQAGTWTPAGTKSYQWFRDGSAIAGATARQYVIAEEDLGTDLTVTVTGTRSGYMTAHRTSDPTAITLAEFTSAPIPTIRGAARYGVELSVGGGAWRPVPDVLAYQWFRDGEAIAGADAATFTVSEDDLDASLSVAVTASKSGYRTQTLASAPTDAVALGRIVAPKPPLLGVPQVGQTLSIDQSGWSPADAAVAYRWQRDGFGAGGTAYRDISGATGPTYTLAATDMGKHVRLIVDVSAQWYDPVRRVTDPTGPIAP